MNPKTVAIAAVLALSLSAVQATTRTYLFTSTIQTMFEHDAQTKVNTTVATSTLAGATFNTGQLVSGRFSYNDAASPSPYDDSGSADGYLVYSSAVSQFTFLIPSTGYTYDSANGTANNIVLSDSSTHPSGWDNFSPFSEAEFNQSDFRSANISLFDKTGTVFNGYVLPTSLSLGSFHYSNLHFAYLRKPDGDQFHFNGALVTLTEVSAVPETSTSLMLVFGIFGLLGLYRRREA